MFTRPVGLVSLVDHNGDVRVLVASDGSSLAMVALRLAAALPWEQGSVIRVLEVAISVPGPRPPTVRATREATEELRREGVTIEQATAYGDAADQIVRAADDWDADLIVTGSRGHGPIETMLLGSVAAAVTDHARCPVLVARRPSCARVLLADDGSEGASRARALLTRWPVFRTADIRVVGVAHVTAALHSGIAPTMLAEARQADAEMAAEARAVHEQVVQASLEDLRRVGIDATAEVRVGDPAAEIIASAKASRSDLILMGSRGRTGVTRALLGSVARNVLLHTDSSVLIVRDLRSHP